MFLDLSRRLIETGFGRDLRRGSNSLNSDSDKFAFLILVRKLEKLLGHKVGPVMSHDLLLSSLQWGQIKVFHR